MLWQGHWKLHKYIYKYNLQHPCTHNNLTLLRPRRLDLYYVSVWPGLFEDILKPVDKQGLCSREASFCLPFLKDKWEDQKRHCCLIPWELWGTADCCWVSVGAVWPWGLSGICCYWQWPSSISSPHPEAFPSKLIPWLLVPEETLVSFFFFWFFFYY
jgi:hypothetical protein